MAEPIPRRRRRSRREPDAPPSPADAAPAFAGPDPIDPDEEAASERGLRGLVGGGSSQVSVQAALRARDAARPTPADLTAAEQHLVIIRRGWTPPVEPR